VGWGGVGEEREEGEKVEDEKRMRERRGRKEKMERNSLLADLTCMVVPFFSHEPAGWAERHLVQVQV